MSLIFPQLSLIIEIDTISIKVIKCIYKKTFNVILYSLLNMKKQLLFKFVFGLIACHWSNIVKKLC